MRPPRAATAASVLADLQRGVTSLAGRIDSLPRRFGMSHCAFVSEVPQLAVGLVAAGREEAFDCGVVASCIAKAMEASAEEARVCAAQLEAYAVLLEREAEDGEAVGVDDLGRSLLIYVSPHQPSSFVALAWDRASLWSGVEAAARVRKCIDPYLCSVSGAGLNRYQAGDVDNHMTVAAVDGEGDIVETIEVDDVTVCMDVQDATVTHAAVVEAGSVEIVYRMPEGCMQPATVVLSVCGVALSGALAPCVVTAMHGDSEILAGLAPESVANFLQELSVWLPRRGYRLLYRGSRDGINAYAFHRLCDGKGPTLVLVRCDEGFVFGGYTGASWESPPARGVTCEYVASPDAFLFSVIGPHSPCPVVFPVVNAELAMWCSTEAGPVFNGGAVCCH
ncbi:MAG: TLD domain-containing protein [Terracidiphilus sp.]|nr:TLD domain-containing protein [Terracidiphilus sp.]